MPETTPKMGLAAWDQPLDFYNYHQLSNNWNIVDFHDHTPQRGVQIPYGGIAPGAVDKAQLTSAVSVTLIPTGGVFLWTTSSAPAGFLKCDGTAYPIATYSVLSGVIGTAFNNSPGAGNFNVPSITDITTAHGTLHYYIKF